MGRYSETTEYISETQAPTYWSLYDVQMNCDFAKQVIAGTVPSANFSHSVSRLQFFCVTYNGPYTTDYFGYVKEVNDMIHPMKGYPHDANMFLEYQIQMCSMFIQLVLPLRCSHNSKRHWVFIKQMFIVSTSI